MPWGKKWALETLNLIHLNIIDFWILQSQLEM